MYFSIYIPNPYPKLLMLAPNLELTWNHICAYYVLTMCLQCAELVTRCEDRQVGAVSGCQPCPSCTLADHLPCACDSVVMSLVATT